MRARLILRSIQCNQAFDGTPLIDGVERLAGDVFSEGLHCAAVRRQLGDKHVNFRETGSDRLGDAAVTGIDDVTVAATDLGRYDRRLNETNSLDGSQQDSIRLRR